MNERDERRYVLLKAAHAFLARLDRSSFHCDALSETVYYDEADCDGYCLMEDIENELETYNEATND